MKTNTTFLYDAFEEKCLGLIKESVRYEQQGNLLESAKKNRELAMYRIEYYEQFLDEPNKKFNKIYTIQLENAFKMLGNVNDTIYDLENDI